MPSVNKLYAEFKDQGLEVLLVDIREEPALVRRTVRERGYVAPVLLDESGEVAGGKYGVWGPPVVYLIDRDGRAVARAIGRRDWGGRAARDLIQALLKAPTAVQPSRWSDRPADSDAADGLPGLRRSGDPPARWRSGGIGMAPGDVNPEQERQGFERYRDELKTELDAIERRLGEPNQE